MIWGDEPELDRGEQDTEIGFGDHLRCSSSATVAFGFAGAWNDVTFPSRNLDQENDFGDSGSG